MLSLYEILKASKTGIAPDMWTALAGKNWGGADSGHEVKELTGIPPLRFRADGTPLLDYTIYGNMSQSGTPTPTTPIQPQETGERTGNLVEEALMSCNIQADGTLIGNSSFTMFIAKIKQGQTYSLDSVFVGGFFASKPTIGAIAYNNTREVTNRTYFIAPIDGYAVFRKSSTEKTAMLNLGSTAFPYEPYGYFIEIEVS